ncbi:MAG: ABC transporter permease subunit [Deltaproteobacteria bacterium]|nr:ABC transporter permease subunit [Deltaproteobacteria bacterium]MBW2419274.1 ABC transporter permease subunit [Deltaproteobacteria bacterium]
MSTADALHRPAVVGARRVALLLLGAAGVWSFATLDLALADLVPSSGGLEAAQRFFSRALSPALHSEARLASAAAPPVVVTAMAAAWTTLVYAAAAMSLSLVLGIALGFGTSSALWLDEPADSGRGAGSSGALAPLLYAAGRVLIALMRSIHELLWAVLLLVAVGLNELAAVLALAIPHAGILAKVFSELIDEAPRDASRALRDAGASKLQIYCFALLPRALPDLVTYAFYRFECMLRSSAVLGLFGFPTLGLYIRQSFASTNYGEVWTYLYALLALVLAFEAWSGAVRRRLQA